MNDAPTKPIKLPRQSKGKRPQFFNEPGVDHLVAMVLELSAELATVYAKVDTLERLLDKSGVIDRKAALAYLPYADGEAERAQWRELFLERLFRTWRAERPD
jgi:hypothetical protein